MSEIVLDFLHSTSVLSFHIDIVLTLSIWTLDIKLVKINWTFRYSTGHIDVTFTAHIFASITPRIEWGVFIGSACMQLMLVYAPDMWHRIVLIFRRPYEHSGIACQWNRGNMTEPVQACEVTLKDLNKLITEICFKQIYNHNKTKHDKTMCISYGIYCKAKCVILWFVPKHGMDERLGLTLYMLKCSEGSKTYIYIYILCQSSTLTWHSSWNPSSSKTRTYLFYIVNIMAADGLVTQGARAWTIIIFTMLNRTVKINYNNWNAFFWEYPPPPPPRRPIPCQNKTKAKLQIKTRNCRSVIY